MLIGNDSEQWNSANPQQRWPVGQDIFSLLTLVSSEISVPDIVPAICLLRAFQRVPPPLSQPGHLWGVHDADHPWKHLPVGHSPPSHQAGHLATLLSAALRTWCHTLHLRSRTVRPGIGWLGKGWGRCLIADCHQIHKSYIHHRLPHS